MRQTLLATTLLLLCVCTAAKADHSYPRTFDGYIEFCATESGFLGSETLPDGTRIDRFFNNGNLYRTGNPLIDGYEENEATATFPPDSMEFTIDIRATVDVDSVDGVWRVRQKVIVGPDGARGGGIGFGTGDLRGKLFIFIGAAVEEGIETSCGVPAGVPIRGRIFTFGWRL